MAAVVLRPRVGVGSVSNHYTVRSKNSGGDRDHNIIPYPLSSHAIFGSDYFCCMSPCNISKTHGSGDATPLVVTVYTSCYVASCHVKSDLFRRRLKVLSSHNATSWYGLLARHNKRNKPRHNKPRHNKPRHGTIGMSSRVVFQEMPEAVPYRQAMPPRVFLHHN